MLFDAPWVTLRQSKPCGNPCNPEGIGGRPPGAKRPVV
jgi:hypothetical protein